MLSNEAISLTLVTGSTCELADLNDGAVDFVREYCRERGYNAAALVREEQARIDAGNLNLTAYIQARRVGSRMRLIRSVRRAVWTVIMTRRALRGTY
jgi:hypothetical protein